jgi:hypothetical protein
MDDAPKEVWLKVEEDGTYMFWTKQRPSDAVCYIRADLAAPLCDYPNSCMNTGRKLTALDRLNPAAPQAQQTLANADSKLLAAEWNAACEACAKAIDDESVLSGFWAADLCRDLKRNGEKETT